MIRTRQEDAPPVTSECTVWVATNATTELGYRHGGLEIIADRETFRVGQTAPVMLVAPSSNRYVLFSVEGEQLDPWYHEDCDTYSTVTGQPPASTMNVFPTNPMLEHGRSPAGPAKSLPRALLDFVSLFAAWGAA